MDDEQRRIERITAQFDGALELHRQLASLTPVVSDVVGRLIHAYRSGGKLVIFGNGGSAADAQHIAAEMLGHFRLERKSWPAIALTTNTSALTAIGNDYSFEEVFSRQVQAWARQGDVVIGITTSGKSKNVIRGLRQAKTQGAVTVGLCGAFTDTLKPECDVVVSVPSTDTPRIQEAHILIGHIVCEEVERQLAKA